MRRSTNSGGAESKAGDNGKINSLHRENVIKPRSNRVINSADESRLPDREYIGSGFRSSDSEVWTLSSDTWHRSPKSNWIPAKDRDKRKKRNIDIAL
jgi:hypothetical protein